MVSNLPLSNFEQKLRELDFQLKHILDSEVLDLEQVSTLQESLDNLAEKYNEHKHKIFLFKLYEIQAYLHFLNDNLSNAESFILEAEKTRGKKYYEAEILLNFIDVKRIRLREYAALEIKKHGRQEVLKGFAWFIGAVIVTWVSYSAAEDGGTYSIFWGAMVFGIYMFARGIWLYFDSNNKAEQIVKKVT